MKPSIHVIASISLGWMLWFFTKSFYTAALCFASGVLVDADHVIEYIIHHRFKNFTFKKIYQASEETGKQKGAYKFNRLYLVFHTGEVALLFWLAAIIAKNIYFLGIAVGYTSHLILDSIGNKLRPKFYFMTWRILDRFSTEELFRKFKKD